MKSKLGKKGQSASAFEVPVEMILWIAGFLIILAAVYFIINSGSDSAGENVCRDSVILRSKVNIDLGITEAKKLTPLVCNAIDKGVLQGDREQIKRQIADMSAKCWWMYLQGSVSDIFKDELGEKTCGVCYFFSIQEPLDLGITKNGFFTEPERKNNYISSQEMYNFMIEEKYNAKLLAGGGTINYIGDIYEFDHSLILPEDSKIKLSQVNYISGDYLEDFSGIISQETRTQVKEIGNKLLQNKRGSLLVLVADEFDSIDKSRARRLVDRIGLNTDQEKYDAVLVLVDLKNSKVRVHVGIDLDKYISEFDISSYLEQSFTGSIQNNQDLNQRIIDLLTKMENKINAHYDYLSSLGIDSTSYYAYISNRGTTFSVIDHIIPEKTYVVAYMSTSSETSWLDGILDHPGEAAVTAIAGAIVTFISVKTGGTFGAIIGGAGGVAITQTGVLRTGLDALLGNIETARPNYLVITRATEVSSHCKIN